MEIKYITGYLEKLSWYRITLLNFYLQNEEFNFYTPNLLNLFIYLKMLIKITTLIL